jgi:hypothetical protein
MDSTLYIYIPRDKILNSVSRKHRENKFKKIYYYKNKKMHIFDEKKIKEVDIYKVENIQINTLYKNNYKSISDEYFDHYRILKPKYNNCDEIYINKLNKKEAKNYEKNKKEQLVKKINHNKDKNKNKKTGSEFVLDWS